MVGGQANDDATGRLKEGSGWRCRKERKVKEGRKEGTRLPKVKSFGGWESRKISHEEVPRDEVASGARKRRRVTSLMLERKA